MKSRNLRLWMAIVIFAVSAKAAGAATISVNLDPGADGTSFMHKSFFFSDLAGTNFNGQTLSFELLFSGAFLVTPLLDIGLDLNQAGAIGTWSTTGLSVSGYLLDGSGVATTAAKPMELSAQMPAQLNPGWPFYLGDGSQYLPATTGYNLLLKAPIGPPSSLINPFIFSGIHFDVTLPDTADVLIGSRLTLSSYGSGAYARQRLDTPISVSPDPIPAFTVPDASQTRLLLLCGLLAIVVGMRWGAKAPV